MGAPLGQHFLHDEAALRAIVAAADIRPGERVLEVGPGKGVLTEHLARAANPGCVVAVEADASLMPFLQDRWDNVELVVADALRLGLAKLGRFDAIVANLPYQISGPVTAEFLHLLDAPATAWRRAVLMFQKEFADRLRAGPGSRTYGRLSVQAARRVQVERIRDVAPGSFVPPPRVMSQIVRLVPHAQSPFAVPDGPLFDRVVDGAFSQRRKKLRNVLPAALGLERAVVLPVLEALQVADRRAEELDPSTFAALATRLGALHA
jgi:16S rRNA (adenine1518-N6/adenine1519-N6)-dimethyltransferase